MEQTSEYRAGLERALAAVWKEKQKHSVISPEYFALAKVWIELDEAMRPREESK